MIATTPNHGTSALHDLVDMVCGMFRGGSDHVRYRLYVESRNAMSLLEDG